jgi:hypothetical protein
VEAPEAEGQPQAVSSPASSRRIFGRAATRYCAQTAYTMNVLPGASPMTRTPDARAHRKRPGHVSGKAGEARAGEAPNGHDLPLLQLATPTVSPLEGTVFVSRTMYVSGVSCPPTKSPRRRFATSAPVSELSCTSRPVMPLMSLPVSEFLRMSLR